MTPGRSPLGDDQAAALRYALLRADFTMDAVSAALGAVANAALVREQVIPALRATEGGSPLETLIRLFLLGATESERAITASLAPLALSTALEAGLVERDRDGIRASLEIRPHGDESQSWWVVSDLGTDVRPGALPTDHVLGVGGASITLAEWTVRPTVATALDIGTGCGVQALHLSRHANRVTATDRNPRALALAAMTAQLNQLDWELVEGDLLEPVVGRRFDLVVSNPPFVVGPAANGYIYRDSGLAGDAISELLVRGAPRLLTDGGWCQLLANWVHVEGADWRDRVGGWLPSGVDAWVVQREVQDPCEYVELWLRDSGEADGPAYQQRYAAWLDWFAEQRVEAIGFGIVTLRLSGRTDPVTVLEDLHQQIESPVGRQVSDWFGRQDRLRDIPLLESRLVRAPGIRLEQVAAASLDGWQVTEQRLRLHGGLGSTGAIDPIGAALVAGADGEVTLRQQLDVLSAAYDVPIDELVTGALPAVHHLVQAGYLDVR